MRLNFMHQTVIDKQTHTDKQHTQTNTQKDTDKDRHTQSLTDKHTDTQRYTQPNRLTRIVVLTKVNNLAFN